MTDTPDTSAKATAHLSPDDSPPFAKKLVMVVLENGGADFYLEGVRLPVLLEPGYTLQRTSSGQRFTCTLDVVLQPQEVLRDD